MGASLAINALNRFPALPDQARLVLVAMCLQARDQPTKNTPAATYWGGHDELAKTLYGCEKPTDNDLQRIKRAMRSLRDAGAVVVALPPTKSRSTVYRLDVTGLPNQDQLDL